MRAARALVLLVATALACGAAAGSAAALTVAPPPPPGQLFVLQAEGGALQVGPGGWRLTLRDPARTVTSFTDRPARLGSAARLRRFVAAWGRTFGDDPPNAALQIDGAPPRRDVVLLELGRPRITADGDLAFRVRPLRTTRRVQLRTIARRADRAASRTFGRASLFVDDGQSSFGYLVTIQVVGPSVGPGTFSLALANSQFQTGAQLQTTLLFGRGVTPSYTYDFSATQLTLGLQSGAEADVVVAIDLPASGFTVQGQVTLPPGYVALFSSEAGNAQASQSGPVAIPAPPPPG